MNAFVVTTSIRGSQKTQIWDASRPMPLGHPFQWVIERTAKGVRVRSLAGRGMQTLSSQETGLREIAFDDLVDGAELELPRTDAISRDAVTMKIRPVREQAPAFTAADGSQLAVFACAGHWVLRSDVLPEQGAPYVGKFHNKPAFSIAKSANGYRVSSSHADLRVIGTRAQALPAGQHLDLTSAEIVGATIDIAVENTGRFAWRFGMTSNPQLIDRAPGAIAPDAENVWFKKALRGAAIGLATFVALSWIWPAPKENKDELIPPQVAKLLLTTPKKVASGSSASAASDSKMPKTARAAEKIQQKVQSTAVVQAFRAKALSNAVSGLLKGGMTQLMAHSDFVTGAEASAQARRIFDTRNEALQATGPNVGALGARNVNVAAIGGGGGGGGKGGTGYGKGEHAGVKGQGQAFVSTDIAGSSVDEGLTKDEVGEVIHRHLREVRYCYESAMLRTPDIEGKLMTSFVIGANGKVKTTDVKSSTLPDPRLDDCILRRLATWQFPNPRGGIDVAVTYPFIFKTLGR